MSEWFKLNTLISKLNTLTNTDWTKPRNCATNVTCPEVKFEEDHVLVRNNINPNVVVRFSQEEWKDLVDAIVHGEYDQHRMEEV